jgi:hypothetical protein
MYFLFLCSITALLNSAFLPPSYSFYVHNVPSPRFCGLATRACGFQVSVSVAKLAFQDLAAVGAEFCELHRTLREPPPAAERRV